MPGKKIRLMSDSKRCSKNMLKNIHTQKHHGMVQGQKCSATVAPLLVLALLISLGLATTLLWMKIFTQNTLLCVFESIPPVLETRLQSICNASHI
jgi:hypothetical protein